MEYVALVSSWNCSRYSNTCRRNRRRNPRVIFVAFGEFTVRALEWNEHQLLGVVAQTGTYCIKPQGHVDRPGTTRRAGSGFPGKAGERARITSENMGGRVVCVLAV